MSDSEEQGDFGEVVSKRRRKHEKVESQELEDAPQAKKRGRPKAIEPPYLEEPAPKKRGRPAKAAPEPPELTREVAFQSSKGPVQFRALKKYAHLHEGSGTRRAHYETLFYGS